MARFGINAANALGVSMTAMRPLERRLRRNHELALELWATGIHEARILAALIDDPKRVSPAQMDQWVAEIHSWDLCDQACMKLFARTPYVVVKVRTWAADQREFVRRAAFALIAGYAVSAKAAPDSEFASFLPVIERHATDERNFVRKGVNWALRQIGKRSPELHGQALAVATGLAASGNKTARWIGKDAVKKLSDPRQIARIEERAAAKR
jgi:3-methyladenine DNA glycosylase AlkD